MRKVYADPATGITRGQFKTPSSGLDMTLDCNRYLDSDSTKQDEKPWDIRN